VLGDTVTTGVGLLGKSAGTSKKPQSSGPSSSGGSGSANSIEGVPATLIPFDMQSLGGPLEPIKRSGGLIFQYTPSITENIAVKYSDSGDLIHTNELFQVYKGTENRKISLGDVTFTADTEDNARYMLAAIHFFRVYTLMDFGKGKSGRPPCPRWFSAYGKLAFDRVPVILSGANITWPSDRDYIKVSASVMPTTSPTSSRTSGVADDPFPSIGGIARGIPSILKDSGMTQKSSGAGGGTSGDYVWVPAKIDIDGISLTVQHSPEYWLKTFSLKDFYSRGMLEKRETSANSPNAGQAKSPAPSVNPGAPTSPSGPAAPVATSDPPYQITVTGTRPRGWDPSPPFDQDPTR
jgi:hypothetical protein